MQRCSYPKAISDARSGLELVKQLPPGSPSALSELPLQVVLGVSLMASKGWTVPEVERAFGRAKELCEQIGEVPQLAPVLWGIWGFHVVRGEFQTALQTGRQLAAMAERTGDQALLTAARYVLAVSAFWLGEFDQAQTHFERLNEGYEFNQHRPLVAMFGMDCGIVGRAYSGFSWFRGHPDRATTGVAHQLEMAKEASHPESMAWALLGVPMVHWLCGDVTQTLTASDTVLEYCNEQDSLCNLH
jgi:predicted ATPase